MRLAGSVSNSKEPGPSPNPGATFAVILLVIASFILIVSAARYPSMGAIVITGIVVIATIAAIVWRILQSKSR